MMMKRSVVTGLVATLVLATGLSVYAQAPAVKRPYKNGPVWNVAFIRIKPGMDTAYLTYVATEWKKEQEAMKTGGIVLSYKVLGTEGHSSNDWNLMLMTEYKDLASMEANQDKAEAIAQKVGGDDQKQMQGYKDRMEIREVMGERLAREIVLEPKP
jgi:hypothetical protein